MAPHEGFQVVMTAPRLASPAVALLEGAGCRIHYTAAYPDAAQVADWVRRVQADAILCRQGRVDGTAMDASPRLRIVARHGVGVDEVDLDAARARGLMVTNTPGANSRAVAEHALAGILALAKGLRPLGAIVAGGGWRGTLQVRDVAGLRLGLVGLGSIGREVARLASAFGMHVAAYDPGAPGAASAPVARDLSPGAASLSVERVPSLAALLPRSDVLSLHLPLLPTTRGLVGAEELAALPPGALVVNTARGGLIDEAALLAALESGHVAGAMLDVFEAEPPPAGYSLRDHPAVIATPHLAGGTPASLERMGTMAAECIVARLTGTLVPAERIVCH